MPDITSNLELYYSFDSGDATDSSGNSRDGTDVGSPTYTQQAISVSFGNYIDTNYQGTFDNFTCACWIKFSTSQNAYAGIITAREIDSGTPGNDVIGLTFRSSDNVLGYSWNHSSPDCYNFSSGLALSTGVWMFCALVVNSTGATLYCGPYGGSLSSAANSISHDEESIGQNFYVGFDPYSNRSYTGQIDEVRIYSRDLASDDIAELFADFTPPAPTVICGDPLFF